MFDRKQQKVEPNGYQFLIHWSLEANTGMGTVYSSFTDTWIAQIGIMDESDFKG
jgi:hypothetical protein